MTTSRGPWWPAALAGATLLLGCSSPEIREVLPGSRPMAQAPEVEEAPERDEAAQEGAAPPSGEPAWDGSVAANLAAGVNVVWPDEVEGGADAAVASVAGRTISVSDLIMKLVMRDADLARGLLDDLLLSRIVLLEAGALGLEPPAEDVQARVNKALDAVEARARKAGAPDLASFVRAQMGLEPDSYLRELNADAAIDALAPRCIRSWLMSCDRREVRAMSVEGRPAADEAMARLARGEAFESVARDLSVDASRDKGGRIPALVRGESVLARAAFATEVGSWTGPVREGELMLFLEVEAIPDVVEGTWAEVGDAVEASLKAQPVEDAEFWQWKEAMTRRHDVDTGPFQELIR
ncbi:MAG: peptidylprolyl isomerase [Planctomycetes bacterium]|nr:peptidylprolyl isomerase [Planctomycetota bacterium]